MTHNHSPKSLVGRHGLTLKFKKFWDAANMCTVPRGKLKSSFRFSSIQTRQQVLHRNTCMQVLLACGRILMHVHASRKRLVRALVSTTLGGKGSIRKANQQELYFAHNSEKKT